MYNYVWQHGGGRRWDSLLRKTPIRMFAQAKRLRPAGRGWRLVRFQVGNPVPEVCKAA